VSRYRFHRAALAELRAQTHWYDARRVGLGDVFLQAVERAIGRAVRLPTAPAVYEASTGVRRIRVHRFPFAVLYVLRSEHVFVVAVAHEQNAPGTGDSAWTDASLAR